MIIMGNTIWNIEKAISFLLHDCIKSMVVCAASISAPEIWHYDFLTRLNYYGTCNVAKTGNQAFYSAFWKYFHWQLSKSVISGDNIHVCYKQVVYMEDLLYDINHSMALELLISIASLTWSVIKDTRRKPRLKCAFEISIAIYQVIDITPLGTHSSNANANTA